jgi:hypothetical protein
LCRFFTLSLTLSLRGRGENINLHTTTDSIPRRVTHHAAMTEKMEKQGGTVKLFDLNALENNFA